MNDIQIFSDVHCYLEKDGAVWLNAEDVAKGFGYTQVKNGTEYVRWETVNNYLNSFGYSHHVGKNDYLPENMVYRLGFKANNETALVFQGKLADEVIPSIRKYGAYATPITIDRMIADPDFAISLLLNLKEERQRRITAESEVVELSDKVEALAPKAAYYDSILSSHDSLVVTQIAKDYGMSPQEFNKRLEASGIQYKVNGQWVLYAKYQGEGYTDSMTGFKRNSNGTWMSTVWTQKGRLFLYTMLKEVGVLPVIERYKGYNLPPISKSENEVRVAKKYYR